MIIFFDGICNLCNKSVGFIIKHDKREVFRFASLQSPFASQTIPSDYIYLDSILLLKEGKIYQKSEAILEICKELDGIWHYFHYLSIFPKLFNDFIYTCIAKNRYRIFGKSTHCLLPNETLSRRFIELENS